MQSSTRLLILAHTLLLLILTPLAAAASPRWGSFKREGCVALGKRQYSSRLWDIQGDWMRACKATKATIKGQKFSRPSRCKNLGAGGMWGQFDVRDASCPYWGNERRKAGTVRAECVAVGYRKYYSRLWDMPSGVDWLQTCKSEPQVVAGFKTSRPSACISKGPLGMWGEWLVKDTSCTAASLPQDKRRRHIATEQLGKLAHVIASKVGLARTISRDPELKAKLEARDEKQAARAVNAAAKATPSSAAVSDGYLLRTMTVGVTAGAKFLIIGGQGDAGIAIDLKGKRPVYAYAAGGYDWGPGLAAGGGVNLGFWVCQNNKIGGDVWGIQFGLDDLVKLAKKKPKLDKGPSFTVGLWFDYQNSFQGFTLTPSFGAGANFGGVVYASTAVDGDETVNCDGTKK